jgi:hypothetical protein
MDAKILALYCVCADLWQAIGHVEDPQQHMSDAEVMTTGLETISIKAPSLTIPLPCVTNRERDHERMYAANRLGSP